MRPFSPGSDYVNQIGLETDEGSERIKAAYGANHERLVALKNKYDPTNLFRHNQNIRRQSSGNSGCSGGGQIRNDFAFAGGRPTQASTDLSPPVERRRLAPAQDPAQSVTVPQFAASCSAPRSERAKIV